MSGFEKQTYTQVPNSLFEIMGEMEESELKVVMLICRYTFGYHRETFEISTRKLAKAIGMSLSSTQRGAEAAEKRGLIERYNDGLNTTSWRAVVEDVSITGTERTKVYLSQVQSVSTIDTQVGLKKVKKEREIQEPIAQKLTDEKFIFNPNTGTFLQVWKDDFKDDVIIRAIDQAIAHGARSITYVDKILIGWKANGVPPTRSEQISAAKKPTQPSRPKARVMA